MSDSLEKFKDLKVGQSYKSAMNNTIVPYQVYLTMARSIKKIKLCG